MNEMDEKSLSQKQMTIKIQQLIGLNNNYSEQLSLACLFASVSSSAVVFLKFKHCKQNRDCSGKKTWPTTANWSTSSRRNWISNARNSQIRAECDARLTSEKRLH